MDDIVYRIAEKAAERGGTAYFVGGCVRDMMMGKESKDIDIEIHNIIPSELEIVLDGLGKRIETGKSFGVYSREFDSCKYSKTSINVIVARFALNFFVKF